MAPTLDKENVAPASYPRCPVPIYPPKLVLCWCSASDTRNDIKSLSLFTDINVHILQHTFMHPKGLLFATQFAPITHVIMSCTAFGDLLSKGFIQPDASFAGHSLGEFSALASVADILPNSSLVDVVFYRGLTMQRAVERDEQSRSNYAMCAVNPSRVSKTFDDAALVRSSTLSRTSEAVF